MVATAATAAAAQGLPAGVGAALARAQVPPESVSLLVVDAEGKAVPRLSHRAQEARNPASVMKLVSTYAALDLLGPAYRWHTPVYVEGRVREGTLHGNLYIKGQGDPKLVSERLWLLLRRVQGLGIRHITGDIVQDGSAFAAFEEDPGRFDGEPLRPYNASPAALLINFKSLVMTFVPDRAAGVAWVQVEPPLAALRVASSVPLQKTQDSACNGWREALKADFKDPAHIRFAGTYAWGCGEKVWSVAYVEPASFNRRALQGMWQQLGGTLGGVVREGKAPAQESAFELESAPLTEIVRDINKYSNNVMAQQLFLSLSLPQASMEASRAVLQRWWKERFGDEPAPVIENGSGLSRQDRISAQSLARVLQHAYRSPHMPELMGSLPISGVDGTLQRVRTSATGSAHLKTGSLRDVTALAGYVLADSGKRYILVALVNHAQASSARAALEALVEWTVHDTP